MIYCLFIIIAILYCGIFCLITTKSVFIPTVTKSTGTGFPTFRGRNAGDIELYTSPLVLLRIVDYEIRIEFE